MNFSDNVCAFLTAGSGNHFNSTIVITVFPTLYLEVQNRSCKGYEMPVD